MDCWLSFLFLASWFLYVFVAFANSWLLAFVAPMALIAFAASAAFADPLLLELRQVLQTSKATKPTT